MRRVPLDAVIPDLLDHMDLPDVASVLAPRPLCLAGMVDEANRPLALADAKAAYEIARRRYQREKADDNFEIATEGVTPSDWLIRHLTSATKEK